MNLTREMGLPGLTQGARTADSRLGAAAAPGGKPLPHQGMNVFTVK